MYHFAVNVGEDCPVFDGLFEFCQLSAGGSAGKLGDNKHYASCDETNIIKLLCKGISKYNRPNARFSHHVLVVHSSLICFIKPFHFSAIAAAMISLFVQSFAYEYKHIY